MCVYAALRVDVQQLSLIRSQKPLLSAEQVRALDDPMQGSKNHSSDQEQNLQ
jgi:hypothetical protein